MLYILFAGDQYYPSGGWFDLHSTHATIKEALTEAANCGGFDWWHIVNAETLEMIEMGGK